MSASPIDTNTVPASGRHRGQNAGFRALIFGVGLLPWLLVFEPRWNALLMAAFKPLCHQELARTLHVMGEPMVICSRCAGIYAGLAAGVLMVWPRRWLRHTRVLLLVAVLPMVIDVLCQALGAYDPWHPRRLFTGAFFGVLLGGCVATSISSPRESPAHPRLNPSGQARDTS